MSAEVVRLYPPPPPEEFRREGLGWVYEPHDTRLAFRARHVKRTGGELWAEVEVLSAYPGVPNHVVRARYNLSIDTARARLAAYCGKQFIGAAEVEWIRLVELFAVYVLDAQHRGEGVVLLGDLPEPAWQPDLIEKLVQAGQITSLYGPQGEGKGWLAVLAAVCVQAGITYCGLRVRHANVLYLDWEADRWTFQRRVKAICAGLGIEPVPIAWLKPRGTIGQELDYVSEYVQQHDVGLVIWDSIGQAGGSPSEHGGGYEGIALGIFEAACAMGEGVSHLWLDHLSAEGVMQKIAGKAHGAIRKMAQARVAWEIRKVQEEESDDYSVRLFHTKFNNTKKFAPLGLRLAFLSDQYGRASVVTLGREDVRQTDNIERLGQADQVLALVAQARHAVGTKHIAESLGVSRQHALVLCKRLAGRGKVFSFPTEKGESLWGLAAENEAGKQKTPPKTPHVLFSHPDGEKTTENENGKTPENCLPIGPPAPPPGTAVWLPYADEMDLDDAPF